jgi:methionyl aminopeptidase
MTNLGTHRIKQLKDGWTILTADGKNSAHFEHDVAVVDGKPDILSTFQYIYDALGLQAEEYEKV